MEFELLGWPADGPTLQLDWRSFSYAGKFVTSRTGKAVARADGVVVAALSFDDDRSDDSVLRIRYVTVREDRRGEGIGPKLLRFGVEHARDRDYERVRIAVNNQFAYEACYRAGFWYAGETTGLAEVLLEWPGDRSAERYRAGLAHFLDGDGSPSEQAFVEEKRARGPPERIDPPS